MSNRVTMGQDDSMMLQRDTLPMQVLNKLMDWIMDGKLKMGEKLNTEELARQLGVSRMPIREALKSLEKMGLAESIPYVGVKLVSLEQEDVLQIYLMRQLLEPLAAGEACKKITEEQIHELEEIMEQNRQELNTMVPAYSKVSEIRIHDEEFEKTPKKSIKRFLYTAE